jgi:hypothetical protein
LNARRMSEAPHEHAVGVTDAPAERERVGKRPSLIQIAGAVLVCGGIVWIIVRRAGPGSYPVPAAGQRESSGLASTHIQFRDS